ncbi:biotin transporter BioY [Gorillibacterium sp. CAU 1737]|uniref:biotin transporter BioY n=1 Tax=Gorillibacterium sp. CAU 1737 TaxID=3140362 RepID=UPI0032616806
MQPNRLPLRPIAYVALFAAIFVVLSTVTIPVGLTPVPITLQTLALLLAGTMIGGGYAFLSIAVVIALTALGFPLLRGAGGFSVLVGYTGGFLWLFPFAAYAAGWFASRIKGTGLLATVQLSLALIVSSALVYAGGIPWYAHVADISLAKAFTLACLPFLPGDLIKVGAAVLITLTVRKLNLVPQLSAKDRIVPLD